MVFCSSVDFMEVGLLFRRWFDKHVLRRYAQFILLAAPAIFEPDCKSPYQIKLANPFCRYVEVAKVVVVN